MYHIFLDDDRMPADVTWVRLPSVDTNTHGGWHIVRSFEQFVHCIETNGMPQFISFDHDLGDVGPDEKNGLSCAKWLVDYCLDNETSCPDFEVHSKNPQGALNIHGLLKGFQQFQNLSKNHKVELMSEQEFETTDVDVLSKDVNKMIYNDQSTMDGVLNYSPTLVDRIDLNGRTWMHHAAESGSWGCMGVLLKHGLEIDTPDVSWETPLHRAVTRNHMDAAQWLLEKGANPNAKNRLGGTPTLYAAEWSADAVEQLIAHGGDATAIDNSNDGIQQWASRDSFLNRVQAKREVEQSTASTFKI